MIRFIVKAISASALAGLAFLSLVMAWAGDQIRANPELVRTWTGLSRAAVVTLQAELSGSRRSLTEEGIKASSILERAPLSSAPLSLVGLTFLNSGKLSEADASLSVALRRNPRNVASRIWAAQKAIDAKDFPSAIGFLDGLVRIDEERGGIYIEALAQLALVPGGLDALERRLVERRPEWGEAVVVRLNAWYPDFPSLIPMNRILPAAQAALVSRAIQELGTEAGFRTWLEFLPRDDARVFRWPFNPSFKALPAAGPFNWVVHTDQIEFQSSGGMNATYLGRGTIDLVSQVMLLQPGHYTLKSRATIDGSAEGGSFSWSVYCAGAGELARTKMGNTSGKQLAISMDFTIPPDTCRSQRLVLRGEPGEFPVVAHANLTFVGLAEPYTDRVH